MILSINKLTQTYSNGVTALDDFTIEIQKGMFGLLGPNGAGKSTLMRIIATLQYPNQGSIKYGQLNILENPLAFRKILGYLPQDFGVYAKDNAVQLLHYFSILKGISSKKERNIKVEEVLHLTNLWEVRHKKVSTYSGGMKQRFGIAQLLLNNPKVIIVDEPTAGLDPAERNKFLNILRDLSSDNIVIFSTHLVEDVNALCSDLAIINKGVLISRSTPQAALASIEGKIWEKDIAKSEFETFKQKFQILSNKYNQFNSISVKVFAEQKPDATFKTTSPNLEDYYFSTINQQT